MKIYAVTSGDHSDYMIRFLTTNKELAEAYCRIHRDKWDEPEIEEYDDYQDLSIIEEAKKYKTYYEITIRCDGTIMCCEEHTTKEEVDTEGYFYVENGIFTKNVITDDFDRALRIAFDERAVVLAKIKEVL